MDTDPAQAAYTWTPPKFDLSRAPVPQPVAAATFPPGDFPRSAKWCSDGAVVLAQCEQRRFCLYSVDKPDSKPLDLPMPAPIVDYTWYPTASPHNPAGFCFVASVRETPVKLLDASDGRLRASYSIVDHRERHIAPHSLAFNVLATRLYCGFEDAIEVFDVGRPGEGTRLHTSPSKKSKDGLKGIISALAFAPSYDSDLYAAGSLAPVPGNIALFSEADGAVPTHFLGGGPPAGVTQLHFNPARPHLLYAAFRRHRAVHAWDLRASVDAPFGVYAPTADGDARPRAGETNQRRRFDVDAGGRWLGVGDQEGRVAVYDLSSAAESEGAVPMHAETEEDATVPRSTPRLVYRAHDDAIGGVAFHPAAPVLLSVAGARHWGLDAGADAESSDSSSDSGADESDEGVEEAGDEDTRGGEDGTAEKRGQRVVRRPAVRVEPRPREAAVTMWDFGGAP